MKNREILKRRTATRHAMSEAMHWSPSGFASRAAYDAFLASLRAAHIEFGLPCARVLNEAGAVEHELAAIAAIEADLGHSMQQKRPEHFARSKDFSWGVGYVLNGSALGASMILRSRTLCAMWPRAYLTTLASTARSGRLRRFFDDLDRSHIDMEDAVSGAEAVFSIILDDVA